MARDGLCQRDCVPATDDIDGPHPRRILDMVDNGEPLQGCGDDPAAVNRLNNEAMRMERTSPLEAAKSDLKEARSRAFMDERLVKALIEDSKADDVREPCSKTTHGTSASQFSRDDKTIDSRQNQQTKIQEHMRTTASHQQKRCYATQKKLGSLVEEQDRLTEEIPCSNPSMATAGSASRCRARPYASLVNTVSDLSDSQRT